MKQLTFLHTAKPLRGNCIEKLKQFHVISEIFCNFLTNDELGKIL